MVYRSIRSFGTLLTHIITFQHIHGIVVLLFCLHLHSPMRFGTKAAGSRTEQTHLLYGVCSPRSSPLFQIGTKYSVLPVLYENIEAKTGMDLAKMTDLGNAVANTNVQGFISIL